MLTTAWSKEMRASARVWWARMGEGRRRCWGRCQEGPLMEVWEDSRGGILPTQRQLGRFHPPLPLNEESCWVKWEQGQERSDSAG